MNVRRVLMLGAGLLLLAGASMAQDLASGEAAPADTGEAALAAPLNRCFTPVVKRCCDAAGATLTVTCKAGGREWPCTTTPSTNDLFKTTEVSATGWDGSIETGTEFKCVYKKVTCGSAVNQCVYENLSTELICKEKIEAGNLCETPRVAAVR